MLAKSTGGRSLAREISPHPGHCNQQSPSAQQEHPLGSPKPGSIHRSQSREAAAEFPPQNHPANREQEQKFPAERSITRTVERCRKNRTPAPQSDEPRNQKPAAESQSQETSSHTSIWTSREDGALSPAHTLCPEPLGDLDAHTQAGGGHTAHPDPLSATRRSPPPIQVLGIHSAHTHAHRAASDTFGSLVDGARRSIATQHTPRYVGHEFTLRWGMAAPPVPCCALIQGIQVSMSPKVRAPSSRASPVTSRGDKSHQMGHHAMTWPPHPSAGPAAPCCGHFPRGSATARVRLLERARFPETSSRADRKSVV